MKITLPITPQSYVNVTGKVLALLNMPEKCARRERIKVMLDAGISRPHVIERITEELSIMEEYMFDHGIPNSVMSCPQYYETGKCKHALSASMLSQRRRVERYNNYRDEVKRLCAEYNFELLVYGWSVYFFHPMPKSWSAAKMRRMNGQWKTSKPDCDNLLKGIFDTLGKRRKDLTSTLRDDAIVAGLAGIGKYWTNQKEGYIEIFTDMPVYNPYNVEFIAQ